MRTLIVIMLVGMGLILTGCSHHKELTKTDVAVAEQKVREIMDDVKQTLADSEKFRSSHPFEGKTANTFLNQLYDEGYTCVIDYLDLPHRGKGETLFEFVRTPLVFCRQYSTDADDLCSERRISLKISWKDQDAPLAELKKQLTSSTVINTTYRCVSKD